MMLKRHNSVALIIVVIFCKYLDSGKDSETSMDEPSKTTEIEPEL